MRKIIVSILLLLMSFTIHAQQLDTRTKNQIKAKYFAAKDSFEAKDYSEALSKINEIEELSQGRKIATAQNLKVKTLLAQGKFQKAKDELYILEGLNLSESILKDISQYTADIDAGIEKERKAREAEIARQKAAEEARIEKARAEAAALKAHNEKKTRVMASLAPQTREKIKKLKGLEEGRPYLITYRNALTSSTEEKTIMIFYGDKYIAYTVPKLSVHKKLMKDVVSFDTYNANYGDGVCRIKLKSPWGSKKEVAFKRDLHYNNIMLGGFGDELLWTDGTQYTTFEEEVFYYSYKNTLHAETKLKKSFQKDYYNSYIETGTIEITADYDLVSDDGILADFKMIGVQNVKSSSLDNPKGLSVVLKPSGNMKMLYPEKRITYKLEDKVKGSYVSNNKQYKGTYLYYRPASYTTHYAYLQLSVNYNNRDLFDAITGFTSTYRLSETMFSSIYESFSKDVGNGTTRYFTSPKYKTFYEKVPEMLNGQSVSLSSISTYQEIPEGNPEPVVAKYKSETDKKPEDDSDDDFFVLVESMPSFVGGKDALNAYLSNNIVYPEKSLNAGIKGKVFVSFIIEKDGSVSNVKVVKGVNTELDNESIRVIKNMPDWIPGTQRGAAVRVKMNQPINFNFQ